MSEQLSPQQLREARIRMEGEHETKRKIDMTILSKQPRPVMDLEDELTKVKAERDRLYKALARATDQLVHMSKKIDELEAALKAKLF